MFHFVASYIAINDNLSLLKFMNAFLCLFALLKPNTLNRFQLVDIFKPSLKDSPSPLKSKAWTELPWEVSRPY